MQFLGKPNKGPGAGRSLAMTQTGERLLLTPGEGCGRPGWRVPCLCLEEQPSGANRAGRTFTVFQTPAFSGEPAGRHVAGLEKDLALVESQAQEPAEEIGELAGEAVPGIRQGRSAAGAGKQARAVVGLFFSSFFSCLAPV